MIEGASHALLQSASTRVRPQVQIVAERDYDRRARLCYIGEMTIKRLDHVSVVVDDLAAAIAFFTALGMTLDGKARVEGPVVDRINGLEGIQVDIVMMRTPDGHGRLELTKFRNPQLVDIEPAIAPPNALGLRSVMFTVESVDDTVTRLRANGAELVGEVAQYEDKSGYATCEALRASSWRWPRSSSEAFAAGAEPVAHQALLRSPTVVSCPIVSVIATGLGEQILILSMGTLRGTG